MKIIITMLIAFLFAVPMSVMGADYPSPCFSCISDQGSILVRGADGSLLTNEHRIVLTEVPMWKPSQSMADNPDFIIGDTRKLGIGTTMPIADIEFFLQSPEFAKAKSIAFRWADERKCFDFAHLREHKQFKEVPCE